MIKPTVFFFISPIARIGTSTLARVVADYFILNQHDFTGFDTNTNDAKLTQRFPHYFKKIDLMQIQGQMNLLDSILDASDKNALVDVWSPHFPQIISLLLDTQFISEAQNRGMDVVFMLSIYDVKSAQNAIKQIKRVAFDAHIVAVINEGIAAFGYEPSELIDILGVDQTFEVGQLDHITLRAIDPEPFSLSRFLMTPPTQMSIVVKAQLKQWLMRIFTQLQSFEMRRSLYQNEFLR
jgi:hypothetical protein